MVCHLAQSWPTSFKGKGKKEGKPQKCPSLLPTVFLLRRKLLFSFFKKVHQYCLNKVLKKPCFLPLHLYGAAEKVLNIIKWLNCILKSLNDIGKLKVDGKVITSHPLLVQSQQFHTVETNQNGIILFAPKKEKFDR